MGIYPDEKILSIRIRNIQFGTILDFNSIDDALEKFKTLPCKKDWCIETLHDTGSTYGNGSCQMWFTYQLPWPLYDLLS